MTIEDLVLERLRELPPDRQEEVLRFLDTLKGNGPSGTPLKSLEGLLEDLRLDFTEEDIAQARREMWGNFPRDLA